jgi:hypothetical protein
MCDPWIANVSNGLDVASLPVHVNSLSLGAPSITLNQETER